MFAPKSKHRALVTLAKLAKGNRPGAADESQDHLAERRMTMAWAQRLKRGKLPATQLNLASN